MSGQNDASAPSSANNPDLAVIYSFFEQFSEKFGLLFPSFQDLQLMLENTDEVPYGLVELHVKLLRKLKKSTSFDRWEKAVVKFAHSYSHQDGWELERFGYKKASSEVKLRLLKNLLEAQFDGNVKFKSELNKSSSNELRLQPLGRDIKGRRYWHLLDDDCNIRVYREDMDEETWELVASDREGVVKLIENLTRKQTLESEDNSRESSEESNTNSREAFPKISTDTGQGDGDSGSEADEPIVSDAIEGPVLVVRGEGNGADCETGNPRNDEDDKPEQSSNQQSEESSAILKVSGEKTADSDDTSSIQNSVGVQLNLNDTNLEREDGELTDTSIIQLIKDTNHSEQTTASEEICNHNTLKEENTVEADTSEKNPENVASVKQPQSETGLTARETEKEENKIQSESNGIPVLISKEDVTLFDKFDPSSEKMSTEKADSVPLANEALAPMSDEVSIVGKDTESDQPTLTGEVKSVLENNKSTAEHEDDQQELLKLQSDNILLEVVSGESTEKTETENQVAESTSRNEESESDDKVADAKKNESEVSKEGEADLSTNGVSGTQERPVESTEETNEESENREIESKPEVSDSTEKDSPEENVQEEQVKDEASDRQSREETSRDINSGTEESDSNGKVELVPQNQDEAEEQILKAEDSSSETVKSVEDPAIEQTETEANNMEVDEGKSVETQSGTEESENDGKVESLPQNQDKTEGQILKAEDSSSETVKSVADPTIQQTGNEAHSMEADEGKPEEEKVIPVHDNNGSDNSVQTALGSSNEVKQLAVEDPSPALHLPLEEISSRSEVLEDSAAKEPVLENNSDTMQEAETRSGETKAVPPELEPTENPEKEITNNLTSGKASSIEELSSDGTIEEKLPEERQNSVAEVEADEAKEQQNIEVSSEVVNADQQEEVVELVPAVKGYVSVPEAAEVSLSKPAEVSRTLEQEKVEENDVGETSVMENADGSSLEAENSIPAMEEETREKPREVETADTLIPEKVQEAMEEAKDPNTVRGRDEGRVELVEEPREENEPKSYVKVEDPATLTEQKSDLEIIPEIAVSSSENASEKSTENDAGQPELGEDPREENEPQSYFKAEEPVTLTEEKSDLQKNSEVTVSNSENAIEKLTENDAGQLELGEEPREENEPESNVKAEEPATPTEEKSDLEMRTKVAVLNSENTSEKLTENDAGQLELGEEPREENEPESKVKAEEPATLTEQKLNLQKNLEVELEVKPEVEVPSSKEVLPAEEKSQQTQREPEANESNKNSVKAAVDVSDSVIPLENYKVSAIESKMNGEDEPRASREELETNSIEEKPADIKIAASEEVSETKKEAESKSDVLDDMETEKTSTRKALNKCTDLTFDFDGSAPLPELPEILRKAKPAENENVSEERRGRGRPRAKRRTADLIIGMQSLEDISQNAGSFTTIRQSSRIAKLREKEDEERRKLEAERLQRFKEEVERRERRRLQREERKKRQEEKLLRRKEGAGNRKKLADETDSDDSSSIDEKSRKGHKEKKRKKKKNNNTPWDSSETSDESSSESEDGLDDMHQEEVEEELVFKSDHEFSPESDLDAENEVAVPTRHARTAKLESQGRRKKVKVKEGEEEEDVEEEEDDEEKSDGMNCQKCGHSDHPEWILLCDGCDNGWHASCLRPALLVIPEGDWFCPPCEHATLIDSLQEKLEAYDYLLKEKEAETIRKQEAEAAKAEEAKKAEPEEEESEDEEEEEDQASAAEENLAASGQEEDSSDSGESDSGSESESGSDEEESGSDDPVTGRRQRRAALRANYSFKEYDALIKSALEDENEEEKENKEEESEKKKTDDEEENEEVPRNKRRISSDSSDSEDQPRGVRRKKAKRLNDLNATSSDNDSDESFKGSSDLSDSEEEDDASVLSTSSFVVDDDSDSDVVNVRDDRKGRNRSPPNIRRSTRNPRKRIMVSDSSSSSEESSEDEPRRKRSNRNESWDESEESSSDSSWGRKKKRAAAARSKVRKPIVQQEKPVKTSRSTRGGASRGRGRGGRTQRNESDDEPFRTNVSVKKAKPKAAPTEEKDEQDESDSNRRSTRGRQVSYKEMISSGESQDEETSKQIAEFLNSRIPGRSGGAPRSRGRGRGRGGVPFVQSTQPKLPLASTGSSPAPAPSVVVSLVPAPVSASSVLPPAANPAPESESDSRNSQSVVPEADDFASAAAAARAAAAGYSTEDSQTSNEVQNLVIATPSAAEILPETVLPEVCESRVPEADPIPKTPSILSALPPDLNVSRLIQQVPDSSKSIAPQPLNLRDTRKDQAEHLDSPEHVSAAAVEAPAPYSGVIKQIRHSLPPTVTTYPGTTSKVELLTTPSVIRPYPTAAPAAASSSPSPSNPVNTPGNPLSIQGLLSNSPSATSPSVLQQLASAANAPIRPYATPAAHIISHAPYLPQPTYGSPYNAINARNSFGATVAGASRTPYPGLYSSHNLGLHPGYPSALRHPGTFQHAGYPQAFAAAAAAAASAEEERRIYRVSQGGREGEASFETKIGPPEEVPGNPGPQEGEFGGLVSYFSSQQEDFGDS